MVSIDTPPGSTPTGRLRPVARVVSWVLGAGLLAVFAWSRLSSASPVRPSWLIGEVAFLAPYVLSVAMSVLVARRARDAERRFWALLATASALILGNEVLYTLSHLRGVPAPRGLMVVLTVSSAAVFIGLLLTVVRLRVPAGVARLRYAVDALLIGTITFVISLSAIVEPLFARHPGIPDRDVLLAAFYPVVAAVVFGGTLTNLFGLKTQRWRGWERLAASGIGLFAVALALWPLWYLAWLEGSVAASAVEAMWSTGQHLVFVAAVYRLTMPDERWDVRPAPVAAVPLGSWAGTMVLGLAAVSAGLFVHHSHQVETAALSSGNAEAIVVALGALLVLRTALMAAENRSLQLSVTHDPVSGLPNHRHFHELLAREFAIASDYGEQLSVAIMDIDQFGVVNDLMGHPGGDKLLQAVGESLKAAAPEGASVCRIGGDEFGIVLPGAGSSAAAEVCERMRSAVGRVACPVMSRLKASFGVATFPVDGPAKDELLRFADGACYWAKLHGKDRVVCYDPEVVEVLGPEDRIGLMQREHVLDTMQALAAAVDARDPGTRFHSRTVAAYAVKIAEDLGMDADRVRLLEVAAILHDVGKIGVSDRVLLKTGPLTAHERKHVQEHPLLADRILSSTTLAEIVPWVVAHHERWDGKGYPHGLPGEEIPLEARILAICDAYDAMISDRPYRSALSAEAALQEIDLNIGTQFDPDIAERFIRIIESERMDRREAAGA